MLRKNVLIVKIKSSDSLANDVKSLHAIAVVLEDVFVKSYLYSGDKIFFKISVKNRQFANDKAVSTFDKLEDLRIIARSLFDDRHYT